MTSFIHTLYPGYIPEGYFSDENIEFIRDKIKRVLKREYTQDVIMNRAGIIRLMERVVEERLESIPRMNQRVIMYAANEFRVHQLEVDKNLKWEAHFEESQRLYDGSTDRGPDTQKIKLANRLGIADVGGTLRFYFT